LYKDPWREYYSDEDWDEVVKILAQHNFNYPTKEIKHDIRDVTIRITDYQDALHNIYGILFPYMKNKKRTPIGHDITVLSVSVDKAINASYFFERTIKHLIKKEKFIEKEMK